MSRKPKTWSPPEYAGGMTNAERAATISLVKFLAADLSTESGRYAQTLGSLAQHVTELLGDRARMQGFGVKDRAGLR